jgi:hypothetical protein
MVDGADRVVDVDLVLDPSSGQLVEAFDAWRIHWFLRNAAADVPAESDIADACTYLVEVGELHEVEPGWFALPT